MASCQICDQVRRYLAWYPSIDLRRRGVISTTHVQIATSPYSLDLTIAELEKISHAVLRHLTELSSRLHRSQSEVIAQINKQDHDDSTADLQLR